MKPYNVNRQTKTWRIKVKSEIQTALAAVGRAQSLHNRRVLAQAGSTGQMVRALQEFQKHLL